MNSPEGQSQSDKRRRNFSISTIVILLLAAAAGIAYYVGNPPALPSITTAMTCSPQDPQVVIPQGVSVNPSIHFQPPTLTVVVGVNNTVGWNDLDTSSMHVVSTVSVPPDGVQWDLNMTGGNSYCITLTTPGTYSYEIRLPAVVVGLIVVKTAG